MLKKFNYIVLLFNGCFSLVLAVTSFLTNIVLLTVTRRNPLRFCRVRHKIKNAMFFINLLACIVFLPYLGITEILYGLQITKTTSLSFPSYLSVTLVFFAQSNCVLALLVMVERSSAFMYPHFHLRIMTKTKVLVTLLLTESTALVSACLQFTGINETVFYTIYIHTFISAPMLVLVTLVSITYRNIKSRNRVSSGEIPQSVGQSELRRKRNTRSARKYLMTVSLFMVPMFLCILPWYIITVIHITCKDSIRTDMGFFLQRFSISLLFLPDVIGPITTMLRFEEYYNSAKRLFQR